MPGLGICLIILHAQQVFEDVSLIMFNMPQYALASLSMPEPG